MSLENDQSKNQDPNFADYIQKEKQNRVKHIKTPEIKTWVEIFSSDAKAYFQNKDINAQTINQYIKTIGVSTNVRVPEYLFWKDKAKIIKEIESKWPFISPENLVQTIADFIKSNLKYDWISFLTQIDRIRDETSSYKSLSASEIVQKEYDKKLYVSEWQRKALKKHAAKRIEELHQEKNKISWVVDANIIKAINAYTLILNTTSKNKPEQLDSNWINTLTWALNFLWSENGDWYLQKVNDVILWNIYEISDQLNEMKVWVCRHFAMIAKILYQTIAPKNEFWKKSELLYALWSEKTHARNQLIRQDDSWFFHQKTYDITRYIWWWLLEWKPEIKNDESKEVWVMNHSDEPTSQIIW